MTDNRLRLNNSKRVTLKKEHWRVENQTPSELKDDLLTAITRMYRAQDDAHQIIEAEVEKRYPKADRDVMRKYNGYFAGGLIKTGVKDYRKGGMFY